MKPAVLSRPRKLLLVVLAACILLPAAPRQAAAQDNSIVSITRPQQSISLGLDKSRVIDLPRDAHDILVANPGVADAVTRTARRIYIFGKRIGQTNIFVFDAAGEEVAVLDIRVERDTAGLEDTIRRFLPNSEVRVEILNDNVVLTGTVMTPQDAAQAVRLADIYLTGGEATTSQYIVTASGSPSAAGGSGVSQLGEDRRRSQIVNLLDIQGEDQVTLKVTVAEVQRSVAKQLGLNGLGRGSIDGISFDAISDMPFGLGNPLSGTAAAVRGLTGLGDNGITAQLRAMEQAGVMRTLAEPTLTAISGEAASFKVGGDFTVPNGIQVEPPVVGPNGVIPGITTLSGRQVEYGIGLDFTPVVLAPGRISLKIRTAVSEPTFESPFNTQGSGFDPGAGVIGIRRRLADTTVELPSGGSLVIAGLVRDEVRQVVSGFPGLSRLPILGTLFRSRDFQRYETELVVIVTPYLVRPVARSELSRPDDGLAFTSDGSANFLGRINRVYGATETNLPPGRYNGHVGYIYK